jgi:transcriptional adapter 2-alpha
LNKEQIAVFIENAQTNPPCEIKDTSTILGQELGYMPRRKEFDHEHENEAEILLSELVNSPEDTQDDQRLKFNLLVLYNQRIKEREKRRNFLIERNKLDLEGEIKRLSEMSWE